MMVGAEPQVDTPGSTEQNGATLAKMLAVGHYSLEA